MLVTMVYGPIAAALVELFPTRIRYTSMSLPYHIGNGWFGGLLPATVFAMNAQNGSIYFGLWYPVVIAAGTAVDRAAVPAGNQGSRYLRGRPDLPARRYPGRFRPERRRLLTRAGLCQFDLGLRHAHGRRLVMAGACPIGVKIGGSRAGRCYRHGARRRTIHALRCRLRRRRGCRPAAFAGACFVGMTASATTGVLF